MEFPTYCRTWKVCTTLRNRFNSVVYKLYLLHDWDGIVCPAWQQDSHVSLHSWEIWPCREIFLSRRYPDGTNQHWKRRIRVEYTLKNNVTLLTSKSCLDSELKKLGVQANRVQPRLFSSNYLQRETFSKQDLVRQLCRCDKFGKFCAPKVHQTRI